ncbi:hypothetical protein NW762_008226 [Fusarium torreyae]|uniref:F-box domain-containing protein n=1 Tax=Fusarium torreyae TaxID=1237075 RepID=A0A9W8RXK5_9HYPO|nr:hypothetical protein NW762_008226 [Fusarium torreyae]
MTKAIAGTEPERLYGGGHFDLICPFLEACGHMRDTALYQVARECKWLPLPKSLAQHFTLPELIFDDEYDTLFITMVLSMTPNLKKLEIGLWTYWKFPWCQPNSLLCLRELTITQWFTRKLSSTDDISGLLAAAPNLERLKFVKVGQEIYDQSENNRPYLHHATVREITFKDCDIPTPNLEALMKGFPNLQTFRYGSRYWTKYRERNRKCFSRAMGQVVMLRKDTIRHLSLQLSNLRCPNLADESLQDLSGMTALEALHIDCKSLYREADSTPKAGLTICNLLPPSIKEFGLMGEVQEQLYEEVLELITTSRRTFPHLKKVIVAHYHHKVRWMHSGSPSSNEDGSSDDNSDKSSVYGPDSFFYDETLNNNRSDWIDKLSSACSEHSIEFSSEKPSGWNGLFTEQARYDWRLRR